MRPEAPAGYGTVLFRAHVGLSKDERMWIKAFARMLAQRVVNRRAFTCVITSDDELQDLNRRFLERDEATDVISFPAHATDGTLGDIAISLDRAETQARESGHSRLDEIRILMLHGVLHLAGMDHARDNGAMAKAEQRWRSEFGLPCTLIGRAEAPASQQ